MKYLKMLALAAVAAGAVMAFIGAGTASATILCETTYNGSGDCNGATSWDVNNGTVLDFSLEPEAGKPSASALLQTTGGTTIDTCTTSTVKGKTTTTGSTAETVKGNVEELTFTGCTSTTVVLNKGTLEIHSIAGKNNNGTVTSTGAEVTINFLGVSCVFKTSATDIGELTGSANTGGAPTFDIHGEIPSPTGGLCPAKGVWSGAYVYTGTTSPFNVWPG